MEKTTVARRTVLRIAALAAPAMPFVRSARAAGSVVPSGKLVLAWHTNIAIRWLDPQQHDGGATPDNFLNVLHDALIKNFREELYDHLALAGRYEFAEDAKSATFQLRRHQVSQRRPGNPLGCQVELRALSWRLGKGIARQARRCRDPRRAHRPFQLQTAVPRFPAIDRHSECVRRRLGGAG